MKKYTKHALIGATTALLSFTAFGSGLVGVKGTLKNVDTAINTAIAEAEKVFEEKRGRNLNVPHYRDLLTPNEKNPYITQLFLQKDYTVVLKLAMYTPNAGPQRVDIPVARALLGKVFVFVPVFKKGDEKVTSWECMTDADYGIQEFMGDVGTKENERSYVAAESDNKYLTTCVYVKNLGQYTHGNVTQVNGLVTKNITWVIVKRS